ncbi:MAG TPA: hypothetical protein VLF93_05035 [Candidatus Saccharimonadales bacterium]|nr:hypothetical protein [Candidatus Saccharimonadales bacterium]
MSSETITNKRISTVRRMQDMPDPTPQGLGELSTNLAIKSLVTAKPIKIFGRSCKTDSKA